MEKAYGFFTDSLWDSHVLLEQICSQFDGEGSRILYGFFTDSLSDLHILSKTISSQFEREGLRIQNAIFYGFFVRF